MQTYQASETHAVHYSKHTCRSSAHRLSQCVRHTHPDRWGKYWYLLALQPLPADWAVQHRLAMLLCSCPSHLQSPPSACGTYAAQCATFCGEPRDWSLLRKLLQQLLRLCVLSGHHRFSGSPWQLCRYRDVCLVLCTSVYYSSLADMVLNCNA